MCWLASSTVAASSHSRVRPWQTPHQQTQAGSDGVAAHPAAILSTLISASAGSTSALGTFLRGPNPLPLTGYRWRRPVPTPTAAHDAPKASAPSADTSVQSKPTARTCRSKFTRPRTVPTTPSGSSRCSSTRATGALCAVISAVSTARSPRSQSGCIGKTAVTSGPADTVCSRIDTRAWRSPLPTYPESDRTLGTPSLRWPSNQRRSNEARPLTRAFANHDKDQAWTMPRDTPCQAREPYRVGLLRDEQTASLRAGVVNLRVSTGRVLVASSGVKASAVRLSYI